ncbi:MAG: GTP-binding protein [Acutalibacteraceae bacterium]
MRRSSAAAITITTTMMTMRMSTSIITITTIMTTMTTSTSTIIATTIMTTMTSATIRTAAAIITMTMTTRTNTSITTIITITTAMTPTRSSSAGARRRTRSSPRPRSSTCLQALEDAETYGIVLRAKGYVANAEGGKWIHFDYVPGEPDIRDGGAMVTGRICVIGSKLNEEAVAKLFGVESSKENPTWLCPISPCTSSRAFWSPARRNSFRRRSEDERFNTGERTLAAGASRRARRNTTSPLTRTRSVYLSRSWTMTSCSPEMLDRAAEESTTPSAWSSSSNGMHLAADFYLEDAGSLEDRAGGHVCRRARPSCAITPICASSSWTSWLRRGDAGVQPHDARRGRHALTTRSPGRSTAGSRSSTNTPTARLSYDEIEDPAAV